MIIRLQLYGVRVILNSGIQVAEVITHQAEIAERRFRRFDIDRLLKRGCSRVEIVDQHEGCTEICKTVHIVRLQRDQMLELFDRFRVPPRPKKKNAEAVVGQGVTRMQADSKFEIGLRLLWPFLQLIDIAKAYE